MSSDSSIGLELARDQFMLDLRILLKIPGSMMQKFSHCQNSILKNSLVLTMIMILFLECSNVIGTDDKDSLENQDILLSYFLSQQTGSETRREALDKIGILPLSTPNSEHDTKEQIALGEKIFRDNKLSKNQVQSCLTCHPIDGNRAGMDRQSTSLGTFGQIGKRNTPTIFNVGYLPTLFWDGRRTKLEDQAIDPFLDPLEMTLDSEAELLSKLQSD
ncbi:cytochrome-c peroxidase [Leptospira sp. GIMC2001]|nr:cytochrome-c peroxidase [Leptospira sp. GIMC2001]WCL49993.1 cytochrome-c peroxidase [Leptospira sp. GIMC2001]